jgi:hypothetical protein
MPEPPSMKLVCTAWHLSPSRRRISHIPPISLCLYMYPPIVASQRLGKNVTAATNKHEKMELLDAFFHAVRVV